jgi:hypothetical protein
MPPPRIYLHTGGIPLLSLTQELSLLLKLFDMFKLFDI